LESSDAYPSVTFTASNSSSTVTEPLPSQSPAHGAEGLPIATSVGLLPAGIVATTASVAVSMTFTSPPPAVPKPRRSATYTDWPSGVIAMPSPSPTRTLATGMRLATSMTATALSLNSAT
jgi:hypothetical protein